MTLIRIAGASALALACGLATAPANANILVQQTTVNGFKVDRYSWLDSKGRKRSVSLKREGEGNAGHGGYAVQFTYQYLSNGVWKTMRANPPSSAEGFGYFVSHERYRDFSDNTQDTIAGKIFNKDDSPLGRGFAATRVPLSTSTPKKAAIQYQVSYPRYGTVNATTLNPNTGGDSPKLPLTAASYALYQLPVRITWYFEEGKDHPRIRTQVMLDNLPGVNRASFDLRGPYGVLNFDGATPGPIKQALWGDRFQFRTLTLPLTRNSTWTWETANNGSRYSALTAGSFEMGLVEPRAYSSTRTRQGYSDGRGKTSVTYNGGNGCPFQAQKIPCDYEWPYQSAQYELPYNNANATTTSKKMAWGSTAYYGMSISQVYDTSTTSQPFDGFPAGGTLSYDVCLVLDKTVSGTVTKALANAKGDYNCADGVR
ncbi:hypothetical protein JOD31_000509 [Methylopila capsulata]|uniref:Secreted protein n=1 Tax=Methylopila capsulata TaxID=61654 RepID=A0A9W6IUU3_9HYPH|nr:hypothetical protein [Methylopila capsulata]MBM7850297.1 hypothetical protein [Methylopila capsulata]GLK55590.1 hypothetical protein GCM10008170_16090 [Methylopila capsulata]